MQSRASTRQSLMLRAMTDYPTNCLNHRETRTPYSRHEIEPKNLSLDVSISRGHAHRQHVRPAEVAIEFAADVVPIVGGIEPPIHRRQEWSDQQVQGPDSQGMTAATTSRRWLKASNGKSMLSIFSNRCFHSDDSLKLMTRGRAESGLSTVRAPRCARPGNLSWTSRLLRSCRNRFRA